MTRMTIPSNCTICRAPNLAQRLFEEEMLVISSRDSMLHRFNEVGTFIWGQLEKAMTVRDLVADVADHFGGFDSKRNRSEIEVFLTELEKKGLVKFSA
jgi:hypothetical protein